MADYFDPTAIRRNVELLTQRICESRRRSKIRIRCLAGRGELGCLNYRITFPDGRIQDFSTGSWQTLWDYVGCYLTSGDRLYLTGIAWP
jgi:hypothetical protein